MNSVIENDDESEWINDPIILETGEQFNRWRCKKCGYIRTGGFDSPNSFSFEDKKPLDRYCGWCGAYMIKGKNNDER